MRSGFLLTAPSRCSSGSESAGFLTQTTSSPTHTHTYLGGKNPSPRTYLVDWHAVQQKQLPYTTAITFNDIAETDGSVVNESSRRANGGSLPFRWLGNILAKRKRGIGFDPPYHGDVDLTDLRNVMDYSNAYRDPRISPDPPSVLTGVPKIKGVRISCKGAIGKFGVPRFSLVSAPPQFYPIFQAEISPVSKLFEFPIRVLK